MRQYYYTTARTKLCQSTFVTKVQGSFKDDHMLSQSSVSWGWERLLILKMWQLLMHGSYQEEEIVLLCICQDGCLIFKCTNWPMPITTGVSMKRNEFVHFQGKLCNNCSVSQLENILKKGYVWCYKPALWHSKLLLVPGQKRSSLRKVYKILYPWTATKNHTSDFWWNSGDA